MPRETLTLVRKLIRELGGLSDGDLEDFLTLVEIGQVEAIGEMQRRQAERERVRVILRLIVNNLDD